MCNFERTKTFKNMLTNYYKFDNIYMSSGDDALQGNTRFPFRTRRLSLLRPMVLHGRLCGRVGGCQVIWIFSSVGQSNRLITGRSGVRVPEGPPFFGGIAQLGEHLPCTQGVRSSNLLTSTRNSKHLFRVFLFFLNILKSKMNLLI